MTYITGKTIRNSRERQQHGMAFFMAIATAMAYFTKPFDAYIPVFVKRM